MRLKFKLLILTMAICVSGCGKNSAVKTAEEAINNIGVVSVESGVLIEEAQKCYAALTENQKDEVENYRLLLDAQEQFEKLQKEEKAKELATEISQMIDQFIKQDVRKQKDIEELNDLYESMGEEYRNLVKNADKIKDVNSLTQLEEYALAAAEVVKGSLKNEESFKLKEIEVITCKSGAVSPYYVSVSYSGTNSFGGTIDKSAFVDINNDGKSVWWSMSSLLGGLEENELLLYNDSLKKKDKEYVVDPERVEAHMK